MRAHRSEAISDVDVSASSELWVEKGNKRMRIDEESRFGGTEAESCSEWSIMN